jgi:eukaryotic-like serine/threonine-protein kinase
VESTSTLTHPRQGSVEPPQGQSLVLGRYRLRERLGAGGFGVVWRAHDELLHREVAVKRIAWPADGDGERASREALATARLAHPAIVALYEACSAPDAFYLISELVEGETLAQLIAADALADEELLEIGVALAGALAHAHARGVIHRDIKPQNVLIPARPDASLSPEALGGVAKLTDFGGARLAGEDALTRTGDVLGTLAYMAPEQSEGMEAGEAADLYSLALVLYEALSGVNPVRGPTPAATVRRIGSSLAPLERSRRDLPRELTRALDRALAPRPGERGTLHELRLVLEATLEEGLRGAPRGRAPRRRAPVPPVLAGLACALAAIVWEVWVGRPGAALLVSVAALALALLARGLRAHERLAWPLGALAPVLGLAGLAGAFPALAGQAASWRERAALGALGYWWLSLAEPLLARHLWLGPSLATPARGVWEGSLGSAAEHVIVPVLSVGVLLGAVSWALGAVLLPWLVRGRSAALDTVAAAIWSAALALAAPALDSGLAAHAAHPGPRGAALGAVCGGALAVVARALRGPV